MDSAILFLGFAILVGGLGVAWALIRSRTDTEAAKTTEYQLVGQIKTLFPRIDSRTLTLSPPSRVRALLRWPQRLHKPVLIGVDDRLHPVSQPQLHQKTAHV